MFENQQQYFDAITGDSYQKPVVHYKPFPHSPHIVVGERANVIVTDHPAAYLNEASYVSTTRVEAYDKATGKFETRNTLYVPAEA